MRVFVTGAAGQLGYDVCQALREQKTIYCGAGSKKLDVADRTAVMAAIEAFQPDAVIHCAAYTAVDRAEAEQARCFAVNEGGARNLAEACRAVGAKLVLPSTDYVFSGAGTRFHETDDPAEPLNVYGASKLAGEQAVRETLPAHFIVRTSWLFGVNGNNFVKTMIRLASERDAVRVVSDQTGSPTYSADLAPLLCDMTQTEKYGVYHATNEGVCSWAELAEECFRLRGLTTAVQMVSTAEYGAKAVRPRNSRLSKASLDRAGFARLPDWRDALARYLSCL